MRSRWFWIKAKYNKKIIVAITVKDKNDIEGFFIYEKTLELFKKSIIGSASLRKYWDNSLSDKENFLKLVMEKIAKMSKEINSLLNLWLLLNKYIWNTIANKKATPSMIFSPNKNIKKISCSSNTLSTEKISILIK